MVAAWGMGLLVVVGVALAGGLDDGDTAVRSSPAPRGGPTPAPVLVFSSTAPIEAGSPVIVLDAPATTNQLITTRAVVVRGQLLKDTAYVQVVLQSRSSESIVVRTVSPVTVPPDNDRSEGTGFVATLPLPDPRPSGPAIVQVVAYDYRGRARDVLLRPVQIGALLDPTYGATAGKPPTGEDGLMGGIPYGTNFAWMSDGSR